jgi:hypothetical protein
MGDGASNQHMVDSPWRAALVTLRNNLTSETQTLSGMLATTDSDMQGGKVWTSEAGGVAVNFRDDLHGKRQRIQTLVGNLLPIVDAAIKNCPEQVTLSDARAQQADLRGY